MKYAVQRHRGEGTRADYWLVRIENSGEGTGVVQLSGNDDMRTPDVWLYPTGATMWVQPDSLRGCKWIDDSGYFDKKCVRSKMIQLKRASVGVIVKLMLDAELVIRVALP